VPGSLRGRSGFAARELIGRSAGALLHFEGTDVQTDGALSGFMAIQSDISERKRAEAELRANQAFLHNTGRVAGVGGWEYDLRIQHLSCSEQARQVLGFSWVGTRPQICHACNACSARSMRVATA